MATFSGAGGFILPAANDTGKRKVEVDVDFEDADLTAASHGSAENAEHAEHADANDSQGKLMEELQRALASIEAEKYNLEAEFKQLKMQQDQGESLWSESCTREEARSSFEEKGGLAMVPEEEIQPRPSSDEPRVRKKHTFNKIATGASSAVAAKDLAATDRSGAKEECVEPILLPMPSRPSPPCSLALSYPADDLVDEDQGENAVIEPTKIKPLQQNVDASMEMISQLVFKIEQLQREKEKLKDNNDPSTSSNGDISQKLTGTRRMSCDSGGTNDFGNGEDGDQDPTISASAQGMAPPVAMLVYLVAFGGVVFTLVYPSMEARSYAEGDHRRLGGGASAVSTAVCYCTLGAGLMANIAWHLKQPILIGYILGGVLVGPEVLALVSGQHEVNTISDLGIVFLLFMTGLELDFHSLLNMSRRTSIIGTLQFPVCACSQYGIMKLLEIAGFSFGQGQFSVLYLSMCSGISSVAMVLKALTTKMEVETTAGKMTLQLILCQQVWYALMMVGQPKLSDPVLLEILKNLAFMGVLMYVAFSYAKFVLPSILKYAESSAELMLVLALGWCFFLCCVAMLDFISLSVELAALFAGIAMASYPHSNELNNKVKYLRDYFITLYFVGVGLRMPAPTQDTVVAALVVCAIVLVVRWIGVCAVCLVLGSGHRVAVLTTLNLSQFSEHALILTSLGLKLGHVDEETKNITTWVFAILAMCSSYLLGYNHTFYHMITHAATRLPCKRLKHSLGGDVVVAENEDEDREERDIVIMGFTRIATVLISEFERKSPPILRKCHVIDHKKWLKAELAKRHITFTPGDITQPDVLRSSRLTNVDLVLITVPDFTITGVPNARLLEVAREVWPTCHVFVIADDPKQIRHLYNKGADYVLATKMLAAQRIARMIEGYVAHTANEFRRSAAWDRQTSDWSETKMINLNG